MLVLLLGLLVSVLAAKPGSKVRNKVKGKRAPPAAKKPSPRALGNDTDVTTMPGLGNETSLGLNITDELEEDSLNDTSSVNLADDPEDTLLGKDGNETEEDTEEKDPLDPFSLKKGEAKISKKSKRNSPDKKSKASLAQNKKDKAKGKGKGKREQRSLDMG